MGLHLSLEVNNEILGEAAMSSLRNVKLMRYVEDTGRKVANEKCPNGHTVLSSVFVFISTNPKTAPYIEESFCCQDFRKHIYSLYDIPKVVENSK